MAKFSKISQNFKKFPKISPHDNFFSTNIIFDICDEHELCRDPDHPAEHVEPIMVEVYFFVVIMTSMREDKCDNDCVLVMASMFVNISELLLWEVRSGLGNLTSAVVAHSRA